MTQEREQSRRTAESVSRNLGWFSLGLGALQLVAPTWISRRAGFKQGNERTIRLCGMRELGTGAAILRNPSSPTPIWARVAGDLIDLSLLARGRAQRNTDKKMLRSAALLLSGIKAIDVACALSMRGRTPQRIQETIAINKSPEDLFEFWRALENLPSVMSYLQSIEVLDDKRSRWAAKPIRGLTLEWEAEITAEEPHRLLNWRSVPTSEVQTAGSVQFNPLPGGHGTAVIVEMHFDAPQGVGGLLRPLSNLITEAAIRRDLRRFKQTMETGEIATIAGQSAGRPSGETWLDRVAQ